MNGGNGKRIIAKGHKNRTIKEDGVDLKRGQ
jgi:hypothetical protein